MNFTYATKNTETQLFTQGGVDSVSGGVVIGQDEHKERMLYQRRC